MSDENYFDVWSDRTRPNLRFVVPMGEPIPSIFAQDGLERFNTMRVASDIACEVRDEGYCSFESGSPLHQTEMLVRD